MHQQEAAPTLYFPQAGPENTEACLRAAAKRAGELGIEPVVVATCSGETAYRALEHFDPGSFRIIAVTHVTGFRTPDEQEMGQDVRRDLQDKGVRVLTCAHAFGGVGRGIRMKLKTYQVEEIMAYTLRMFGQGVKVGVEMALMCADAGLVRTDQDVATIGGTMTGADTALVVAPANSHNCLDLKVREIVAKPRRP
jgi:hypothetical protein